MIIGLGIDVVEIERMREAHERFGDRLANRMLTEVEKANMPKNPKNVPGFIASRFAAKEAAVKALGTGFSQGIGPTHVEILTPDTRKPEMAFHGPALAVFNELGATHAFVSLSHEKGVAAAVVVLERRD